MADPLGTARASATADRGYVRATISGHVETQFFVSTRFDPHVLALSSGQLTFSGPTGAVTTRPNIDLSGTIHHTNTTTFYVEATRLDFKFDVGAAASRFSAIVSDGVASVITNDFVGLNVLTLGTDLGVFGSGMTSQGMTVPVGVPVDVTFAMLLSVGHLTAGFPPETSFFAADFKHTASFAQGGPVFDLPEGYTVNGFGIVDNRFVIPVPEPTTTLYTFFLSLGCVAFGRRWRKC